MSPSLINVILHLGKIINLVQDGVGTIEQLLSGKDALPEAKQALADLMGLLASGLFVIPGLTDVQVSQIVIDIDKALGLPTSS